MMRVDPANSDSPEIELTEEDQQAIEEGEAQLDRAEGKPWEELRAELQARYLGGQKEF